ncbi:hypothetical protein L210DRAFT_958021 [Boletus edulis BED1]|uniref:F-box domain-containing protein n=1 Tax=Boletus edulis BED1 TaxID=1328754 RepID=A0AAD4GKM0_BOLED|nr:hypothetical protein L210DRAFT_958021 [Boletus edulis BED1]
MSYHSSCKKPNHAAFVTFNGRLKRGSLNILPSLALDILCEIFCFLRPTDLFALARTSKTFRRFLLKRSAVFIWKSARRNVGDLPEPPSDMSEVQYASLTFGFACHYKGCDGKACDTVWHLRIRSCANCRSKHQPIKANECADYLELCGMLTCYPDTLEQYIPCGPFLNSKGKIVKGFQEHHIKAFADELRALPLPERQAYLDRCKQATEVTGQFASAGVAWQLKAKNVRLVELRNKRAARAEIIREDLIAAGFREEIDHFGWDRIRKHSLINSTQAVSEKVRSSILDQLMEYMLGWQELRMEEQVYAFRRRVFIDAWLQFTTDAFHNAPSNSPYLPLPPNATIGFLESIDSVIRQSSPISHESLLEQLQATFVWAREYILEWHKTTRRELASLLPGYKAEDDDETVCAQLNLATSVFQCTGRNCRAQGRTLTYPEILFHPCFTLVTPGNGPSPKDPRGIAHQKACLVMGGHWNCSGRVQMHPRQCVVDKLLLCYGRDPGSTTAAEMDKQGPRFRCAECAGQDKVLRFMSWRCAVQHNITIHPDSALKQPWFMASRLPRVQIDPRVFRNLRPFSRVSGDTVGDYSVCLLCPPRIPSWNTRFGFENLMVHIKDKHGVPSPVFGTHYKVDVNITPLYLDLVIIKQ